MSEVIPEAAVEAAREASVAWSIHDLPDDDEIRALLEAAAPHMLAEAWDAAYEIGRDDERIKHTGLMRGNPYRSVK